ncbi:isochorismatase family hydrolase [Aspergillus clavatus NRRL 1]|uniref:Isocitrate dehydrogenase family protein n=1 Tax=Aspergillus clavatus (strain ATCC 1007 / CBS 513.65 / DSM 816 / NCTC 3887 / NRRL 1 / QM 1276 / 107) TaxID=344612 RepID=A1CCQ0_ASPCL|nr:isocitrate dehydrogenase family protein [Aspergillus clavatus NRRL 1]EAW12307.1 isocitrate dehydrogenase family protein [Aspergillus clavatus NRRL 1]
MASLHVGLAVGNGTGPELTAIFERVIQALAAPHNLTITFTRSPRLYHSYSSLLAINDKDAVTDETLLDASHYRAWCEDAVAHGVRAIFRTSISAQALYLVREQLQAIKVEHFKLSPTASVLLVRDQAQGFYSGTNSINPAGDTVSRTAFFSKDVFTNIVEYALLRARRLWPTGPLPPVTMIYKFHLFDGLFHSWAQEWQARLGVRVRFVQGDTMNRDILAFGVTGHQLFISANEYADIMQTVLLDRFGLGAQEAACAENVYLHPALGPLSEYQTAHGSADDLAGKGTVNPAATIRAAAMMLQNQAGCLVQDKVDWALEDVWKRGIATPDRGGQATTAEFVDAFLQTVQQEGGGAPKLGLDGRSRRRAVVVVDLQNDMVTQYKDQSTMTRVTANIPRVLEWARQARIEVIFVRFLGDEQFQPASWRQRNQLHGRRPWCVQGTWGADIFGSVAVQAGERVFDKKARYDPFLVREFEHYVAQRGFEDLLVVGLYADVCVDATVRGAFQRGLTTTIVRGCMAGLHFSENQVAAYMQQVYGSNVIAMEELA